MIRYPFLNEKATVGVTAPSSGVNAEWHDLVKLACSRLETKGFNVVCGETVWTQNKAKSSPAQIRADEFNTMMQGDKIDLVIPPWGGELLIEILEYLDFISLLLAGKRYYQRRQDNPFFSTPHPNIKRNGISTTLLHASST